jgi:hypothetical protein
MQTIEETLFAYRKQMKKILQAINVTKYPFKIVNPFQPQIHY